MREERELFISSQITILFECLHGFEQRVYALVAILGFVTLASKCNKCLRWDRYSAGNTIEINND